MKRLKEDCYGAKVGNIIVTTGDDMKDFIPGSRMTFNVNGKDTIRCIKDMPEDLGITVKGYPIYYSDFNFIPTEDFDDWYDNFDHNTESFDDWWQFDRKNAVKNESIKNNGKRIKETVLNYEDMIADQADLEDCWQMLANGYKSIWNDIEEHDPDNIGFIWTEETGKSVVDFILSTKVFWREGFIKNDKGAMLGCTQLKSEGRGIGKPVVLISTITDELSDAEFYNVLLHEMCHVASYYGYGSLDPDHKEGWKKFANKCNKNVKFLKNNPLTATCDIDKFY